MSHVIALAAGLLLGILPPSQARTAKPLEKRSAERPAAKKLVIAVGQVVPLRMSTKRPIRRATNDNDKVVRVQSMPNDPTTVLVIGLAPGRARITLLDADDKKEVCVIGGPAGR